MKSADFPKSAKVLGLVCAVSIGFSGLTPTPYNGLLELLAFITGIAAMWIFATNGRAKKVK